MAANDRQIGGDHYRKISGEQHWDRIWRLFGPGYFVGCITAYVERYQHKNGVQDLEKAQHFLEKLIELEKEKKGKEGPGVGIIVPESYQPYTEVLARNETATHGGDEEQTIESGVVR